MLPILWTLLITTAQIRFCQSKPSMEEAVARLEKYENEIKVFSWFYDAEKQGILHPVNLLRLDPTVIAIQNVTRVQYEAIKRSNQFLATNYEESGFKQQQQNENEVYNPILFKGHVFLPVEEESFTGVFKMPSGQVAWNQVKMLDPTLTRKKRSRRDSVSSVTRNKPVNKLEFLFDAMGRIGVEDEGCRNQRGAVIVINVNMKDDGNLREELSEVMEKIYTQVMCRRAKKIIVTGTIGWIQSYNVIRNFRRRADFFKRNGMVSSEDTSVWNVNQIWSSDFAGISGTSIDIFEERGVRIAKEIKGRPNTFITPAFCAFHFPVVRNYE